MKRIIALVCFLLCLALLASCNAKIPDSELDNSKDSQDDIDLVLWTFPVGNWGNPTAVSSILVGFHKEHPDIRVSVEYLDYVSGDEKISQAVQNGYAPDLVFEGPERIVADWGEKGWMADLSGLWDSEHAGEIYEHVHEACHYQNGAYYEFPICVSAHCMAINYDMFKEAGALQYIDEEHHTWTTDGFINAVKALKAYGQEKVGMVYCENQSGDQGTRALVTNLYGGTFTDKAHGSYTVDSEENIRALQLLYDLDGITFEPSMGSAKAIELFCKKETAMCFCWNVSLEVQQTINNPDFNFEVFPIAFPTNQEAPELEGGIWGFGIFDNGDETRIEAAKTFIRYITEDNNAYTKAVLASSYWPVREMEQNIYENDMLMTEYSIFMPYMRDYHQVTPGWTGARTAWWKLLAKVGDGENIAKAVKGFPSAD